MHSLKTFLYCVGTALLMTTCAQSAPSLDKNSKPKKAETAEQAIEFFEAAAKSGDYPGALEQIAEPLGETMLALFLHEEAAGLLEGELL